MTDRTPNRRYSFPECDPPLVKDRSDIIFLRDLAEEVNADMNGLDSRIVEVIEFPDATRLAYVGTIVLTSTINSGGLYTIPYNFTSYDNAGAADLTANGIRIQERGWYMFTSSIRCTDGGGQELMCRHMRNGLTFQEGRRLEGTSFPVTANDESMAVADVMLCQIGDLIQTQGYNFGVNGTFNFDCRLTMIQLVPLDI